MFPRWILLPIRKQYLADRISSKNFVSRASERDFPIFQELRCDTLVSTCKWKNKSFREERDVRLSEGYYRPGAHVRRRINDIDIHVVVTSRAAPLSPQKFLRESDLNDRRKKKRKEKKNVSTGFAEEERTGDPIRNYGKDADRC